MAVARATFGGSGEERRRSTEMIKRREARETLDAGRKHQAEKCFPEEPHATRLADPAVSNPETQAPRREHAAIGKHGRQFPDHHYAGGRRRRRQQNKAAPGSLIWLARVCRKWTGRIPSVYVCTR